MTTIFLLNVFRGAPATILSGESADDYSLRKQIMKKKEITRDQAFHAINTGEFDDDVIASNKKVAVILTQDW